uniref:RNase H type-1 domain-containing protein n=1 Tax=Fagus sylvatica TaxID=28930 RepID=A0A2N9HQG1_FAGSY
MTWSNLAGDRILWRRLFHTLEKQGHITPLEAPPGPSTGDACEYHSGARGHSLECCEEFKKEITNLTEKGLVKREEIPSEGSCQPYDPSNLDWYAELNLDNIVEDEMDLDDLMDEGDAQGYFMEDDTDEWRNVDFSKLLQFPCLIAPHGFETPEFEIFYENGNPEVHLQKYGEKMALHVENELLMISVFPESLSRQAAAWFYQLRDLTGWEDLARAFSGAVSLQSPFNSRIFGIEHPCHHRGGEFHHTTDPPLPTGRGRPRRGPVCHCYSVSQVVMRFARKTSNDSHVSEIDNKADCSLDNIDNSDEEVELPNDILEALERQDEGSKPNIEELEIINLADEGEEPREVKIGTRSTTEQKEALIALLREFHEIFAWSYQDMPGLDTDIVVHKIPLKPECKPVKQALRRMKPEVILKIKEEVEKQLKAGIPEHTSPKDNFPLPHIDTLVDNTATNAVFSFMDGFSGYNQIKMAEEDKSKTAFVTHWGTFVYDVMPFGLKNAGATYQRAMVTLFHDMIHHEIEVYVDDMIAKSRTTQDHLTDLRKLFQRLKKGIEIDPAKVQAIRSMPAPKNRERDPKLLGKDQLHSSLHCTAHCNLRASVQVAKKRREDKVDRRIARKLLTKSRSICSTLPSWFHRLQDVPSSYTSQSKKHPMGCMLGQQDETGRKEQAIYYLSKKFTEPETRYLLVEKTCCALAWASKKLRQYMLYYTTWLDGSFTFDGAANSVGSGIGAVLVSPKGQQTPIAVKLGFDCTNNMTEYEACIVGLQVALEFGAYELEVFGDSLLIVSQTNGEWQARDPKLIPYQRYISQLVPKFKYITFTYTPRAHNHFADALATLASLIKEYPPRATENEKKYIRRMAFQFFLSGEILYKRTHDATLLRCVDAEEANRLIQEMHAGLMGAHANGPFLARKIHESWLLLVDNGEGLHQTCPDVPQSARSWGMDVIGAITPKASNGHEFILVAIDYFTKWVEACSFKNVTQVAVTRWKKPEWAQAHYEQLNFIDEKRLAALCHGQLYQRRIERAYNKKARPRTFQPGDLVLKKRNTALSDSRGKFAPSYEGPYVVKKAFSGGAIILADMDGEEFRSPINSDSVIKYHV